MYLQLILKLGVARGTLALTALCVLVSFGLYALFAAFAGPMRPIGIAAALLIPAFIVPAVCYALLRIFFSLYRIQEELLRTQNDLECRIADRTGALEKANEHLREEIEERKVIEERLLELGRMDADALRTARMGHWEYDVDTHVLVLNDQYYSLHGTTAAEAGGCLMDGHEFALRYVHPEDVSPAEACIARGIAAKAPEDQFETEFRILHSDGALRNVVMWFRVERDADGRTVRLCGVTQDITERRRAQAALRESEDTFRLIFEQSGDANVLIDEEGRYIDCNEAALRLAGLARKEDLLDRGPADFAPERQPDGRLSSEKATAMEEIAFRDGSNRFEWVRRKTDGTLLYLDSVLTPIPLKGKKILYVVWRDITARKKVEEALAESVERFRLLTEASHEAIMLTESGVLVDMNEELALLLGYSRDELVGRDPIFFVAPGDRQRVEDERRRDVLDTREVPLIRKDGAAITTEVRARSTQVGGRKLRLVSFRDITQRRAMEERLEITQYYVDKASLGVWRLGFDARILYVNQYACDKLGYTAEELCSMSILDIDPLFTQDMWVKSMVDLRRNGSQIFETAHRRKDGTSFPVEIMSTFFLFRGEEFSVAFVQDISERKLKERENEGLHDQLLHAQKMEAMGRLAGGIAHDFNNILSGIQGYTSLMLFDIEKAHPHYERLQRIESQVKRGSSLTRQLLGFAQGGMYEVKAVNVNTILTESSDIFAQARKEITLIRDLQQDVWNVQADRGQIEQVLLNLYINASHAMPEGGDLYLETRNAVLSEDDLRTFRVKAGHYVSISVTDRGCGMEKTTLARIFEPFFTTKEPGKGTGMGLASAYGIIKNHGGYITAYSEVGEGSTFMIYLPASEQPSAPEEKGAEEKQLAKGEETILVVDDEAFNIAVTSELLRSLGYRVFTAGSGQEAIATYMDKHKEIDLVLLDLIMPGMGGKKAFEELRKFDPAVKVVLSSGYGADGEVRKLLEMGCNGFIQKPFRIHELSTKIREILAG